MTGQGHEAAGGRPRVTIGLPLYNGAEFLEGCLDSIARQTFTDFRAFAIDNASTDATPDILAAYAARDPRFTWRRNAETKPAVDNFLDVLAAADTDYFLWRAYDDYTSENFLEELVALLDANPQAELAVARVVSLKPHKNRVRTHRYPLRLPVLPALDLPRMMFRSHAAWIYGLWRTAALRERFAQVWHDYHELWANDHLVIFDAIIRDKVVGTNQAIFYQRVLTRPYKEAPDQTTSDRFNRLTEIRARFVACCEMRLAAATEWGWPTRRIVGALLPAYTSKRVYRRRKLRRLKRRIGRANSVRRPGCA
jgi:glycosyltransferase involved in cell wall biosynthesis